MCINTLFGIFFAPFEHDNAPDPPSCNSYRLEASQNLQFLFLSHSRGHILSGIPKCSFSEPVHVSVRVSVLA